MKASIRKRASCICQWLSFSSAAVPGHTGVLAPRTPEKEGNGKARGNYKLQQMLAKSNVCASALPNSSPTAHPKGI